MRFQFWLANHSKMGQRSLEDVIGIFGHQLRALGHEVTWRTENDQFHYAHHGMNILVEGFMPDSIKLMKSGYDRGARFLILATEEPTPKGFNHGLDPEMVMRQSHFPEAAKYCEGIFHLVPGKHITDWYGQWAPAAFVELGYAKTLRRPPTLPGQRKYDFGFFGSLTKRRFRILKRLQRYSQGSVVRIEATFPDQLTRDNIMRQCKVILQLRKFDEMGLVSSSRCNTALNLGCAVFAEPHDVALAKEWAEIVRFSKANPIDDTTTNSFCAEALLMKTAWSGIHAAQYEKFKTMLTPEYCVGRAFQEIGFPLDNYDGAKLLEKRVA